VTLTVEDARRLIDLAQENATGYGKPVTVAVVDSAGFLIALERQDGARPLTPSIATSKAYSAITMRRPTALLKQLAERNPTFFAQLSTMAMQPIVATDGGIPIQRDGELIGALAVSGATETEDHAICQAALAAAGYDVALGTSTSTFSPSTHTE
jgi:uncharacterized protein GlcG (DUF336 family)